jgi:hypothetical protein
MLVSNSDAARNKMHQLGFIMLLTIVPKFGAVGDQ